MARGDRRVQGLARVAVVVRAGAAPMWWFGVLAAGVGAAARDHRAADRGDGGGRTVHRRGGRGVVHTASALHRAGPWSSPGREARRAPGPRGDHAELAPCPPLVARPRSRARAGRLLRGARRGRHAARRCRYRTAPEGRVARPPRARRRRAALDPRRLAGQAPRRPRGQAGQGLPLHRHRRGRRDPGRGAPAVATSSPRPATPPGPPRSSSAGGGPSPGWPGWRPGPGRGRGRCRRAP